MRGMPRRVPPVLPSCTAEDSLETPRVASPLLGGCSECVRVRRGSFNREAPRERRRAGMASDGRWCASDSRDRRGNSIATVIPAKRVDDAENLENLIMSIDQRSILTSLIYTPRLHNCPVIIWLCFRPMTDKVPWSVLSTRTAILCHTNENQSPTVRMA